MSSKKRPRKPAVPRYDTEGRELWARGKLIKMFRQPAGNQEAILLEFERRGWPPLIDDPLPRVSGTNPKKRLHDAIQKLNRGQRVIRFFGDGTGRKLGWMWR